MDWFNDLWASLTFSKLILGLSLFVGSLAISFIAIGIVMVKVPPDYFSSHYVRTFLPNQPWHLRFGAIAAKNLLGVFLIIIGIVLSVPGIPGQGILTILLGLVMIDIPGKRPLEARIIKRPTILAAVNKLRSRYGKEPLQVD